MRTIELFPIGVVHLSSTISSSSSSSSSYIEIAKPFRPGLQALQDFGHINVIWWFDQCDNSSSRKILQISQPYNNAPAIMGVFATRSPQRPNPIALTTCQIIHIDPITGIIQIPFIDASEGTPVIDIKPYTPSFDRVAHPQSPSWCATWPKSTEESGDYDWSKVFVF